MGNSSLNKSKINKNLSPEGSPRTTQQQQIKESHFQNRNMESIARSPHRKNTPGWGQEQMNLRSNTLKNQPLIPAIRNSNKKNGNTSTMDLENLENWKSDQMDFIISGDKNI